MNEPTNGMEFERAELEKHIKPLVTMDSINDKIIKKLEEKIILQEQMIISLKTKITILEL